MAVNVVALEDAGKKVVTGVRTFDSQLAELQHATRSLTERLKGELHKLNERSGKLGGAQIAFDAEPQTGQSLLSCTAGSLETFEQQQKTQQKAQKDESDKREKELTQVQEEIERTKKDAEDFKKKCDSLREERVQKKKRLEEESAQERSADDLNQEEQGKKDKSLQDAEAQIQTLTQKVSEFDEEYKAKKVYHDALVEQRKKDMELLQKMAHDQMGQLYSAKIELFKRLEKLSAFINHFYNHLNSGTLPDSQPPELP